MNLNDYFSFGQYSNLTLLEVYQGTSQINANLLKDYLRNCWNDTNVPKTEPQWGFIEQVVIRENEITVFADNTFDENKQAGPDNLVHLGNLSGMLSNYFNSFYVKNKWYGIVESFEKFNHNTKQVVIGGDPEYIEWCIGKNFIDIKHETKSELEKVIVNRFKGIEVSQLNSDKYTYSPVIKKDYFKFTAS